MIIDKIKKFLKGWEKKGSHEQLNTYWKRFRYFPLNWMWTIGSLAGIGMFIEAWQRYEAEVFLWLALIPFILLVYNFVDEYYEFQWSITGTRKVTAKTLNNIVNYSVGAVIFYIIIRVFIIG